MHEIFKTPTDREVLEITTAELLEELNKLKNQNIRGGVEISEFMKHLVDKYQVGSPYELGIMINSLPLAMQVI